MNLQFKVSSNIINTSISKICITVTVYKGSVSYKIDRNYVDLDVQRINYLDFANDFRQYLQYYSMYLINVQVKSLYFKIGIVEIIP